LFVSTENFETVRIYAYKGESKKSALEIKRAEETEVVEVSSGRTARLTPKVNTWYAFESDDVFLRLNLTGQGEERWKNYGDVYRFESQNQYLVGLNKLDLSDFSLGRQNQAHLFGVVQVPDTLTGSSAVNAIASEPTQISVSGSISSEHTTGSSINLRLRIVTLGFVEGGGQESSGEFTSSLTTYGQIEGQSNSSEGTTSLTITTEGVLNLEPYLSSSFSSEFSEPAFDEFIVPRGTGFIQGVVLGQWTFDDNSTTFDTTLKTFDAD
jgi:hypothetical protein